MKAIIKKASDYEFESIINIATLEDLKKLQEQYKADIIVSFNDICLEEYGYENAVLLTVYDDYIE